MRRLVLCLAAIGGCVGCAEEPPAPPTANVAKRQPTVEAVGKEDAKTEKAHMGVGASAQRVGEGLIATPVAAGFRAEEQINFGLVKHAVELYKAMNGDYPTTQAEFNERILKENQIQLPELPAGDRYVYDPKKGELLVEHGK